jgi:hypothetical protein
VTAPRPRNGRSGGLARVTELVIKHVLPKPIQGWTLMALREKLVKIGGRDLVKCCNRLLLPF